LKNDTPLQASERNKLGVLFFLLALGAMSLAPRLPDIKSNLDIPNGQFGTLVGSGALGALVSQFFTGHIVHRFGARRPLTVSVVLLYGTLAAMVHIHSPFLYFIVNVINGASWSMYHISINAQGLHRQKYSNRQILPMMHGLWTTGAITTTVLAFLVADHIGVAVHIDSICAFNFVVTLGIIYSLRESFLVGNESTSDEGAVTIKQIFSQFRIKWVVSIGFLCSLMLEISLGDWSTIYTREHLNVSKSVAVIPYFFFMSAMVFGRLNYNRFHARWSEQTMLRYFPLLGGIGFIIPFIVIQFISEHKAVALIVMIIGFICGGVGSSFIAPLYFVIVGRNTEKPGGVAVAELGAVHQVLGFMVRIVIAWVAQLSSLSAALFIPATLLVIASFFYRNGSPTKSA
jgi:MFS family permease